MYYFDNEYLREYLELKVDLEIYVHGKWCSISTVNDISDPSYGICYDFNGKSEKFDYREITMIKAAGHTTTLDQLQDIMSGNQPDAEDGETGTDTEFGDDKLPDPMNDKSADADSPDNNDSGDKDKSKKEHLTPRKVMHSILESRNRENKILGAFIRNIDESCEYYNTRGVISAYYPSTKSVDYRIYDATGACGKTITKRLEDVERFD